MGYENAPATKMLATNCAACGRDLVDAESVSAGMGPNCRKRHALPAELDEETRQAANRIVYEIAKAQTGIVATEGMMKLRSMGCTKLADRIQKRLNPIVITDAGNGRFALKTPYSESMVAAIRRIYGRRWDPETKTWTFPAECKCEVWVALVDCFHGAQGVGPQGAFTIARKAG